MKKLSMCKVQFKRTTQEFYDKNEGYIGINNIDSLQIYGNIRVYICKLTILN